MILPALEARAEQDPEGHPLAVLGDCESNRSVLELMSQSDVLRKVGGDARRNVVVVEDDVVINMSQGTIDCEGEPTPRFGVHVPGNRSGVSVSGGTVQNCLVGVLFEGVHRVAAPS